ncbi:helix-turn-helix and ligand-binding sensor domain-containing protein [Abyssalbus ytuae]|uniref:LuxR C-terminal-related transcriptional regulator n=1 Tax=Abyssalbus ytuae TaxID=2926907 RepID=A0A9E7CST7_9FLAO|nr:triple tyrosine motif-containing protein [Abyssalbus ytuae]UOB16796.1 LuxR C-terminal-related transcriptional regulator [Abyssalbus ytuae]
MNKIASFLYFIFFSLFGYNQELPPVINFSPENYKAGNQNWKIDQDKDFKIFTANNDGLLEYNGSEWKLHPSPNETIIRSVKVIDHRIYVGCYMEFGYFSKDSTGLLNYTSISQSFKDKILDDEHFWNIIEFDSWVIFQSLNQIFIYNTTDSSIALISPHKTISKIFKVNNSIFFFVPEDGLYEIVNGKSILFLKDDIISNLYIVDMYSYKTGYLLLTENDGFYTYLNNKLSKWNIEANQFLNKNTIYSATQLKSGGYALGSISNGLVILDNKGKIKYKISHSEGLFNNTILSVFEDKENNIWLGLDNGISCLNLQSPFKNYNDYKGTLGTVYATAAFEGYLYLGTNQGLFSKPVNSSEDFSLIKDTNGQVWTLFEYANTLFCGHNLGTFTIKNNKAEHISTFPGTWYFRTLDKYPDLLIQGNYMGLGILQQKNGKWEFSHKIEGFDYSSKHFEILKEEPLTVYVSHEYRGIYKLEIDSSLNSVKHLKYINKPEKSRYSSLVKFDNQILYAFKNGIYTLKKNDSIFVKNTLLSKLFEDNKYKTGKLIADKSGKLWIFTNNNIYYITKQKFDNDYKIQNIPIEYDLIKSVSGFDNINYLGNEKFLMGSTNGYLTIDLGIDNKKNYNISIDQIKVNSVNSHDSIVSLKNHGRFLHKKNNITFKYFIPEYNKFLKSNYQYTLEGFHDKWSNWSTQSYVSFENLPFGDYTFKVAGKVGDIKTNNIASYSFTIQRPWYLSNMAIFIYSVILLSTGILINYLYKRYYRKQRERIMRINQKKLEYQKINSEKEIIRLKNEQLVSDVESKNRELAVSTMSLIKKNEFLIQIRDLLKEKNKNNAAGLNHIIKAINKDVDEEDTWNFFKEAFNNADKDFLKKIKEVHPSLTPNDLRLCAYLRLNLSSKEIAPLLNISVRSVEIKRYRLRKKMNLDHEKSLVEYILDLQ